MSYKGLPEHLVARINPVDARAYAAASGWVRVPAVNGNLAIYSHPKFDLDQLLIPLDAGLSDYPQRMAEVVANLAEHEGRLAPEVLNDLLLPPSDVLRFRLDEPDTQAGVVGLEQGLELLQGAKKTLLAAACSVVQPQKFHPRLSRTEAEQLLQACRLGQTERGSFTAVIACPLDAVGARAATCHAVVCRDDRGGGEPRNTFALPVRPEPFTRQTTGLLMRSVARIVTAIDADQIESLLAPEGGQPVLSRQSLRSRSWRCNRSGTVRGFPSWRTGRARSRHRPIPLPRRWST